MNNKIKIVIIVAIILLIAVVIGGLFWLMNKKKTNVAPQPPIQTQNNNTDNNTQIANPASVFCEQNGGKLEIRTGADGGQLGYCKFPDGSECEEWAYQRGECKPGDSLKSSADTSDRQTYRNEKYGYEIKYPNSWISSDTDGLVSFKRNGGQDFSIIISVSDKSIDEIEKSFPDNWKISSKENEMINSINWTKYYFPTNQVYQVAVYNGNAFGIQYATFPDDSSDINSIISTFKFIAP